MSEEPGVRQRSMLEAVANALVQLHKEQFGRGPSYARAFFAGPDMLVCEMRDVLLPAERRMLTMGDLKTVTDTRTSLQAATRAEFTASVESIVGREVVAFASAIDPDRDVVYENFSFARVSESGAVKP